MRTRLTESVVEEAALAWLESLGTTILHGPDIAPGEPCAEREDYGLVVLIGRLRQALDEEGEGSRGETFPVRHFGRVGGFGWGDAWRIGGLIRECFAPTTRFWVQMDTKYVPAWA